MGKLQLTLLFIIGASFLIHLYGFQTEKNYLKHIFLGKNNERKRILYLDYIRLTATLWVLLVHCLDFSFADLTAGSASFIAFQSLSSVLLTCNTLFIMNSGALILNKKIESLGTFYYKRFFQVAIPFVCYYTIYILLSSQYFNSGFISGVFRAVLDMAAGPIDWAPHLWVVYVILSLYLLAPFFSILLKNLPDSMLHALAVLILLTRCMSLYLPIIQMPLNLNLMIAPYESVFLLGYYFAHPVAMKHKKGWLALGIASLIFTVLCVAYRSDYPAILSGEGAPTAILTAGALFLLFKSLEPWLPKPGYIVNFFIRYSYSILMVHWAILYYVRERFGITQAGMSFLLVLTGSAIAAFLFDQTVVLCAQRLFSLLTRRFFKRFL